MKPATVAWWINADAEVELATPGYRRSPRMAEHCRQLGQQLRPEIERWTAVRFPGAQCVVVAPDLRPAAPRPQLRHPVLALAWAPTASAMAAFEERGWRAPSAWVVDAGVLARANHRSLFVDSLPGSRFATTLDQTLSTIASAPPAETGAERWLLKRALGFAGRWRKALAPGSPSRADRTWIEASMAAYGCGLQIEPLVRVQREWARHGWIGPAGQVHWAPPRSFVTTEEGCWDGDTGSSNDVPEPIDRASAGPADRCAAQLAAAGYQGPLGIDGFAWVDAAGNERVRAVSDTNARFTTRWFAATLGLGLPDLGKR